MLDTVFNSRTMAFIPQVAEPAIALHLLVVDADSAVRSACAEIAASLGYAVESTGDLGQARSLLRGHAADILLVNLPSGSNQGPNPGLEMVSEVKLLYPDTSVIAMTATGSVNAAVEAMRCGASDYLTKPFAMDELSTVLDRAAASHLTDTATRQLRERLRLSQGLGAMIGRSVEMEKLYRILSKVAQSSHPVLILGESGTGTSATEKFLAVTFLETHGTIWYFTDACSGSGVLEAVCQRSLWKDCSIFYRSEEH